MKAKYKLLYAEGTPLQPQRRDGEVYSVAHQPGTIFVRLAQWSVLRSIGGVYTLEVYVLSDQTTKRGNGRLFEINSVEAFQMGNITTADMIRRAVARYDELEARYNYHVDVDALDSVPF